MNPEVLVIGGGHNGLVAATALARAQKRVLLLEARDAVGGIAAAREFHAGYRVPGLLHETGRLRSEVIDQLGLRQHGVERSDEVAAISAPSEGGESLRVHGDRLEGPVSESDHAAYAQYRAFLGRIRKVIGKVMSEPAPDPLGSPWPLLTMGLSVRMLGERDMIELARVAPTCVADWMRDRFENERLGAALAARALQFGFVGPWAANTAANLLVDDCLTGGEVRGGPAAVVAALEAAAREAGVQIRTGARVEQVLLDRGAVAGVRLEGGEELSAGIIASAIDPKQLFLDRLGPQYLEVSFAQDVRSIRARGTAAKVHLALSAPLRDSAGTEVDRMLTGETLDDIERAYDALKYRQMSERPVLDVWVPSRDQSGLAPAGHHVVSIIAHAAPHDLEGGWDDAARATLQGRVLDELCRYCPEVRASQVASETLTPVDLEREYGLTGGQLLHAEHAPDQLLFMRPTIQCGRHRTPIEGLYLCGSGAHPGGGITGAPGLLGAGAILRG